ncbi:MAG: 6-carboxytetrahydropterin synthase [Myxococcota bacterium]|jgi:6-pyruvoyltetrahydropterin/6-carboxytetrahydropterin synthase|nr:6-carboxytetrahydropterin synthase [Myxococcota bacterium]
MIYMTRRYSLAAAHVLAQPAFTGDQNERIFGKCANPGGHGHDYMFEVSVKGSFEDEVGQIIAPGLLDEIFEETVARRFAHRLLNDAEPFGSLVPTAENIARVCRELLAEALKSRSTAELAQLRVTETPRNFAEQGELL